MKKIWMGIGLAAALTLVGCGGDKPPETAKTDTAAPAAAAAAPLQCPTKLMAAR